MSQQVAEKVAHTPGPWTVAEGEWNGPREEAVSIIAGPDDTYVAHAWADFEAESDDAPALDGVPPRGTALANARLIAASPDLLEASREIVNHYGPPTEYDEPYRAMWQRLVDAIAKAEGR